MAHSVLLLGGAFLFALMLNVLIRLAIGDSIGTSIFIGGLISLGATVPFVMREILRHRRTAGSQGSSHRQAVQEPGA